MSPVRVTGEAAIRHVVLDHPERRNQLDHATMQALADALEAADADPAVRCVVVAGHATVFAAGADLHEMAALDGPALAVHPRTRAWQRIFAIGVPLVAAVEGPALGGGCELVQACDVVIAGAGATFGQPEIGVGWLPGAGGTQRLPRSVGKATAMQLVLTGQPMPAERALAAGLVSEVVPAGEALARATAVAERIATLAPGAVRRAKAAVLAAFETPLAQGLEVERGHFQAQASSAERAEGIAAFLERRRARFDR
ncbi:MAG: enoyl-CoA hydratase-related protein [Gemmatimonadota bacterium]